MDVEGTKLVIGYTQGTFDMFHVGHLNLINAAKRQCDFLIVGVNSDKLVQDYKHKAPVIPEVERRLIVENIKAVDQCVIAHTLDKTDAYLKFKYDLLFIGDDWKGNSRWIQTEAQMEQYGVKTVYLPHTSGISSSQLRTVLDEERAEEK